MADLNGDRLYRGDGKIIDLAIANTGEGSLVGAAIRFVLARLLPNNQQLHLLTLTRAAGQIAVSEESTTAIAAMLTIPGTATATLEVPRLGATLQWDIEITPTGAEPFTKQGTMTLLPDTRSQLVVSGAVAIASAVGGEL